jgi:uncharacterized protein YkwD
MMVVRAYRTALLAVILAVVGSLGLAQPAAAATGDPAAETDLVARHNDQRRQAGLAPLAEDPGLREVARAWAGVLAASANLRHNPDLVAQVDRTVTAAWTRLGENVGRGPTAGAIDSAFLNSPGHRANILGDYNRVGIGAVRDNGGQLWVAAVFMKGPALAPAAPAVQSWAPFSSADALASQQYADFLGRSSDAAGTAYWADLLRSGRMSAAGVVESFLRSPEFEGMISPVVRLFLAHDARPPSAEALFGAIDARIDGMSLGEIAGYIAGGNGDRLVATSSTPEFQWQSRNPVLVTMAYVGMLRRAPEAGGFDYWVQRLSAGQSPTQFLGGILASPEYAARF